MNGSKPQFTPGKVRVFVACLLLFAILMTPMAAIAAPRARIDSTVKKSSGRKEATNPSLSTRSGPVKTAAASTPNGGRISPIVTNGVPTPGAVFSNPAAITINDDGVATPYPSNITVSGLTQNIASLTLTLTGFSHTFPGDVDMLLVAPNGATYVFWSDISNFPVNADFTLDDNATNPLPDSGPFTGGTFRPANYSPSDTFPGPAPAPPYVVLATNARAQPDGLLRHNPSTLTNCDLSRIGHLRRRLPPAR